MTFDRPPLERYIRCSVGAVHFLAEPALEYRDGDAFTEVLAWLRGLATLKIHAHTGAEPMVVAQAIGRVITATYPDRAWFVEVWPSDGDGFAQVVQPFGFPRNR